MTQPVLIIGSGALACLFSARLSRSGQPVTLTGTWEAGLSAIRQHGVGLLEGGVTTYLPVDVLMDLPAQSKFGLAILLTKAHQTTAALERVKPVLDEKGTVLSLQNGLTARRRMVDCLGEARSLSGTTTCGAELVEPGIVRHNGGSGIILGEHPAVDAYRSLLEQAGFDVTVSKTIHRALWEKAVINSAANPVSAILRMRNGEMAGSTEAMSLMDALIAEACAVASADGCELNAAGMQDRLRKIMAATLPNRTSMLQDVLNSRKTEIEDINGAILELAEFHHIHTPVQRTVTQLIRVISKEEK